MSNAGRPPTPTTTLLRRGSRHGQKRLDREPYALELINGTAPEIIPGPRLSSPARIHWDELKPILSGMAVLTPADVAALERLCELKVLFDAVKARIDAGPCFDKDGNPINSDERLLLSIDERIARAEQQFGLTPVSRARISIHTPARKNEKAKRREKFEGGL